MSNQPLWRCPHCEREFANRNQAHTCAALGTVDDHFVGKPPEIRKLFDCLMRVLKGIGPVRILPEKTRIAFQTRMSFAQVTPRRGWLDGHLVLARRLDSSRFRRIDSLSPRNHVHFFRLVRPEDIDDEFRSWLVEAYAVGQQHHLGAGERA